MFIILSNSDSFVNVEEWFKEFVKIWLFASDETIKSRIENIIKIENVIHFENII